MSEQDAPYTLEEQNEAAVEDEPILVNQRMQPQNILILTPLGSVPFANLAPGDRFSAMNVLGEPDSRVWTTLRGLKAQVLIGEHVVEQSFNPWLLVMPRALQGVSDGEAQGA